jgi:NADH-quinone oxidoreductase subunit E/NADP-reducing hydrogenase subunit HndA
MVVDDDPVVLRSCERILGPAGYEVRSLSSPREALAVVKSEPFDLVITDMKMPEMDGLEFIRQVRESARDVSIMLITGFPSQESIKEALAMGIVDYLPKPFSPALLLDVVEKAVQLRKHGVVPIEAPGSGDYNEEVAAKLDAIIARFKGRMGSLIPVLQEAQGLVGYLPPVVQRHIARGLNLPVSEVHGVVSFYSFFSMKPKGKYNVKVCLGTACYVKRAEEIVHRFKEALGIDLGGVTEDRKFSLESVRCLGACGLAPVVVVNNHDTYGSINPVETMKILEHYSN